MKYIITIVITLSLLVATSSYAEDIFNYSPMTAVKDIPEDKVEELVKQMDEQGLSVEEALNIARLKGATEVQITELRTRIESVKSGSRKSNTATIKDADDITHKAVFSEKGAIGKQETASKVFGFQFFNTKNPNFASNLNAEVSDNYILSIGDNIHINVYGVAQQDYSLEVRKNRAINIPGVGPVYVGGLSLARAKALIRSRLSTIYDGLNGNEPNTFLSINVGDIAGININVIGEAINPGTYTLPATATVFNALYLAGGPGENGSFRTIEVLREGKKIADVDVYDYLIKGDTRSNVQLRNNDVILIKPFVQRIFIKGAFKRNGFFEAKPGETVADLINYVGGFTATAYEKQINLTRNNTKSLLLKTIPSGEFATTPLANGDMLEATEMSGRFENRVSIEGAVYRPGDYELKKEMTLYDLLNEAEGVKEEAFLERGIITRKGTNMELITLSFSVKDVISQKENIVLSREDKVLISSIFDMREERYIQIFGAVQTPGNYTYSEGMTLEDLIFISGGFLESASISNIEIARRLSYEEASDYSDKSINTFNVAVDRDLNMSEEDSKMKLMPFDYIYVRYAPGYAQGKGTASVSGEIKYAGSYGIATKKERISDLVKRAGGISPEGYPQGASLRRKAVLSDAEYEAQLQLAKQDSTMNVSDISKEKYYTVTIDLYEILSGNAKDKDLLLRDGDRLFIPKKLQTVQVVGAVLNPVTISFEKGMTAKDYINRSGGFALNAKKNRVYVLYPNGEAYATKNFIFRSYPKIVPGAQIIVPEKPEVDRTATAQRWIGIGGGLASIAASIAALISISR